MKKILLFSFFALFAVMASAQHKFDPAKFRAELHQYIITEAGLTQAEQKKFFPIYDEMRDKQRAIYEKMRGIRKQRPSTETACRSAIIQKDNLDVQLREVERTYHQRFLKVLDATKVYNVIMAEERFHRRTFRKFNK